MDAFPYIALGRGYTLGTPRWRIIDSGVDSLRLANGVLRTRPRLDQALYVVELRIEMLGTPAARALWSFYQSHRSAAFEWTDTNYGPLSTTDRDTWEVVFDPASPPNIVPRDRARNAWDADLVIVPLVPTVAV